MTREHESTSSMLWTLADFGVEEPIAQETTPPDYWYTGQCPQTGMTLKLARTEQAKAIAHALMTQLAADAAHPREGKMYGVLLVTTPAGELRILKAFSGLLKGQQIVDGWVPPIPGRDQVALAEAQTLERLEMLRQQLVALKNLPERQEYARLSKFYHDRLQTLSAEHRVKKENRDRLRAAHHATLSGEALEQALASLITESQQDGIVRRRLKKERDAALSPLQATIAAADKTAQQLKRERKALSRQLQKQMHAVYSLTNFFGTSATLQSLMPGGLPTGSGDCAAPKLLHYAATHHLNPVAIAEFWWGAASQDKQPGQFYGACAERCQPIMGFLLSGLPAFPESSRSLDLSLPILYQDDALIVIDKPSGLLSVPGRRSHLQDSVLSRLQCQLNFPFLKAAHRLDKGTSGILVLATSPEVHANLSRQFAQQQVHKTYESILSRPVAIDAGVIDLPLWRNPQDRPKQSVNFTHGKPSRTHFQVLQAGDKPRLRFIPKTGRTHQLRVHAAHPDGLNAPILGDTLYGDSNNHDRLYLHATSIQFTHPIHQTPIHLTSPIPF